MNGMWSDSAIQTQKKAEHYQKLSFEQKMIFNEIVFNRKNAYIAGITCSGKSHLIRSITKSLQAMFGNKIFVTAISRSGAQNINGQLLQHIFQLKVDKIYDTIAENEQFIFQNVKQNLYMQIMFKELQVLIIDEVSMLPGYIFDAMDMFFQRIKENSEFFGGLQVILCGDFMQLPPISKTNKMSYLFDCEAFKNIELKVQLCKSFSQYHDQNFLSILNQIRDGFVSHDVLKKLQQKVENEATIINKQKILFQKSLQAVKDHKFRKNEQIKQFQSQIDRQQIEQKQQIVELVQNIKNIESQLLDLQFIPPQLPIRLYNNDQQVNTVNIEQLQKREAQLYQIQADDTTDSLNHLKLMDKPESQILLCQGAQIMLNRNVDLSNDLCIGTVGIVRKILFEAKEPLKNIKDNGVEYQILNVTKNAVQLEIVVQTNIGIRTFIIKPFKCTQVNSAFKIVAKRLQLPIQLAYAINIYKSQGITVKDAIIQLDKSFDHGQAYIALSRLQSLDGLHLTSFDPNMINCQQECVKFHNNVSKLDIDDYLQKNIMYTVGTNLIQPHILVETTVWTNWIQDINIQYATNPETINSYICFSSGNSSQVFEDNVNINISRILDDQQQIPQQNVNTDNITQATQIITQYSPEQPVIGQSQVQIPINTQMSQIFAQTQKPILRILTPSQRLKGKISPINYDTTIIDISDSEDVIEQQQQIQSKPRLIIITPQQRINKIRTSPHIFYSTEIFEFSNSSQLEQISVKQNEDQQNVMIQNQQTTQAPQTSNINGTVIEQSQQLQKPRIKILTLQQKLDKIKTQSQTQYNLETAEISEQQNKE
ncbi:ATP-dependent_DNA helicase [Hexamita inflata]|uniref:ATP-dependent DNA helicase n=1 Tax=Hexamita inflata TaxID=28002 RepID=A0AA86QZY8_9EUKA|nr:ATP-dependent DNA helicase [Hexamita inflata]